MTIFRTLSLATAFALSALAAKAQTLSTPEAPVQQFLTGFEAGDTAKALAAHSAAGVSITDEFAPFHWHGTHAFTEWAAALTAECKADGITEPSVTLGALAVKNQTATLAYLIYPATYVYKQKGVAMREPAQMAFVVKKEGPSWKIVSWTWTGTVPQPAK